jgi:hypothetical protein
LPGIGPITSRRVWPPLNLAHDQTRKRPPSLFQRRNLVSGNDRDFSVRDRTHSCKTGLHALPTRHCADLAVLVMFGVTFTFFAAKPASRCAGVQHPANDFLVRPRSAGRDTPGHIADVSAIQVQPNTLLEFLHHVLSQTSIRARRAGLCTRIALLHTVNESVVRVPTHVWMSADHFMSLHVTHLKGCCGWRTND